MSGAELMDARPLVESDYNVLNYEARDLLGFTARYRRMWTTKFTPLDQTKMRSTSGCSVAAAFTTVLGAKPVSHPVSLGNAQVIAGLMGGQGDLLSAVNGCLRARLFERGVWFWDVDEIIDWVVRQGPVVLASPWTSGMVQPTETGGMLLGDDFIGYHACAITGYWPQHSEFGDTLVFTNTWGPEWGLRGKGFMPVDELKQLVTYGQQSLAVAPYGFPPRRRVDE